MRARLRAARDKTDPLSLWLQGLCARRNKNVAAVALANKTMRLAWVLLRREEDHDPLHGHATPARAGLEAGRRPRHLPVMTV